MTFITFQENFTECIEKVVAIVVLKIDAVVVIFIGGEAAHPRSTSNLKLILKILYRPIDRCSYR